MHKSAGRPWPVICDDPVTDYLVMEAVAVKADREDNDRRKAAEIARWKEEQKTRLKNALGN